MTAAATCQNSLTIGRMPRTSSTIPTITSRPAPTRMAGARREADRDGECHRDGHAPEPRDRNLVNLALGVGLVQQAEALGVEADQWGDRQAHDQGDGGRQGGQHRPRW